MADNYSDLTVFARIDPVTGAIAEYPVFALHIRNRAQPFDWYTQVEFATQPEIPAFHNLREIVTPSRDLAGNYHVKVTYVLVPNTLAEVLNTLRKPSENPTESSSEPLLIADVPLETVGHVATLATAMAQARLDEFAHSEGRNYDSINTAVSYKESTVAKFASEGKKAFEYRDATWVALYDFLGKVTSSQVPVPVTVDEIAAVLPVLTWE